MSNQTVAAVNEETSKSDLTASDFRNPSEVREALRKDKISFDSALEFQDLLLKRLLFRRFLASAFGVLAAVVAVAVSLALIIFATD